MLVAEKQMNIAEEFGIRLHNNLRALLRENDLERFVQMSDFKLRPYKVTDNVTGDVTYVKHSIRAGARAVACRDRFTVEPLTVQEAIWVKPEDVVDGTAAEAVHPDQQPLAGVPAP